DLHTGGDSSDQPDSLVGQGNRMIQSRGVEGRPPKGVQPGISGYRGTRSTPVAAISTSNASSLSAVPTLVDGGRMASSTPPVGLADLMHFGSRPAKPFTWARSADGMNP